MQTSSDNHIIEIRNISKSYDLSNNKEVCALKNINLNISEGEILGIIGANGSGKSTLLKILSEITAPDTGEIAIKGKVASILEIGTGFNPDLSGKKNIYLNASLHGMKKKEINSKFNSIADLFGFQDFLNTPVKQYSSGMYMRLAFAIVVHIDSDIYLFDEVMSIGDAKFQKQASDIIKKLRSKGKTIGIVSHAPDILVEITDRIALFNKGEIIKIDKPEQVIQYYKDFLHLNDKNETSITHASSSLLKEKKEIFVKTNTFFNLEQLSINSKDNNTSVFNAGSELIVSMLFRTDIPDPISIGIYLNDSRFNQTIFSSFTKESTYDKSSFYQTEFKIPQGFLNKINLKLGVIILRDCKILINYPNILSFKVSPKENSIIFHHVKGFITPQIESTTKKLSSPSEKDIK